MSPEPEGTTDRRGEIASTLRGGGTLVINASELGSTKPGVDIQHLSITDDRLLDMAADRKSFEQMYQELGRPPGMTAASIGSRVRTLLAAFQLDGPEQKALLLRDLVRLRDIIFERLEGENLKMTKDGDLIDVGPDAAWANAMVRVLKEWRSTIESMQKDVEGERQSIREAHAQIMLQAITVMFDRFVGRLEEANSDEFSGITFSGTRPALMRLMEEVMPLGFQHLQENVDEREQRLKNA